MLVKWYRMRRPGHALAHGVVLAALRVLHYRSPDGGACL